MGVFNEILGYRGRQQTRYLIEMEKGRPGLFVIQTHVEAACVNGEDVAQVSTITIATGSGNYTATLNEVTTATVAFDTDDTTTAALLRDALRDLDVAANFNITSAAGVITVTARFKGPAFTLTSTGTNATDATPTAAAVSGPITIGTLVRGVNGLGVESVVPADAGDFSFGIAGGSDYAQLNYFQAEQETGIQVVERGMMVSILREGTCWALFETPGTANGVTPLLYRNAPDGALDTIGILNQSAGTGLVTPTDITLKLLEDTIPLENGLHAGFIEVKL